jgi:hypothetical protein
MAAGGYVPELSEKAKKIGGKVGKVAVVWVTLLAAYL